MPIGNVTIDWEIRHPITKAAATGKVRFHVPRVLHATTDDVIYGPGASDWIDLDGNGRGSIQLFDPHDVGVTPQGWAPVVEVDSNVWKARYPVAIPTGSAGQTLHLADLSPVVDEIEGTAYALVSHTHEGGGGSAPDATTSTKGILQLAGDLAGTAAAPTVPGLATKYVKPGGGIPSSDLAAAVQTSLGKADSAVQPGQLAAVATSGAYDDLTGTVPTSALPAIAITEYLGTAANQAAMLALVGQKGDWCTRTDLGTTWIITGNDPTQLSSWTALSYPTAPVASVNGQTGVVSLAKGDIGLGNVANLAPADLPVSTAQQALADTKINLATIDAAGDLLVGSGDNAVTRLAKGSNGQVLSLVGGAVAWATPAASGAYKARSNTGLVTSTFTCSSGTGGAWTVCPSAYRVTVPAAVGDLLRWEPGILANPGDSGFEFDLASVNGSGTPLRYASSRTGVQSANGHGALYMGGAFSRTMRGLTWIVDASDIVSGNVTLALMYRAGTGLTIGSALYPSEIDVINHGVAA